MKILYIGHLREGTGWSKAANSNILSLISSGQDVVCKSIDLTQTNRKIDDRIEECIKKEVEDIDVCIQHVLPHHLVASDLFKKNIAFFEAETSTIKHLSWYYNLRLMDQVWVPCKHNKEVLVRDGIIEDKVKIVPHTFDINKYSSDDKSYQIKVGTPGFFKFYTISDLNDRKNLDSIIRCFHSEFKSHEPVELILKIHSNAVEPETLRSIINEKTNHIKNRLRIYPNPLFYKKEIVISEYISEEEMTMLHKSCDCFISPSHGEGFSIPAFEAMLYGNTPICSDDGGPKDFIDPNNKDTGTLIKGVYDICDTTNAAFSEINTGLEEWFHPSESEIKSTMRHYYDNKHKIDRKSGLKQGSSFDSKIVSKKILEIINES